MAFPPAGAVTPSAMIVWMRLLSATTPMLPETDAPVTLPAIARPAKTVVSRPEA